MSTITLRIHCFGQLKLVWDDTPLPIPSAAKSRSLLAYVILHHDRPIPRDRLVGLLWPNRPETRARRALSQALWQIRTALGPAAERLATERESVTFRFYPDDWLDVEAFESQVQEVAYRIQLYRGDFLEDCYDDWALLERERLRELYLDALEYIIAQRKQAGDYKHALIYAQKLAAADPLREAAHRELMQLYHLLGRPQTALSQFGTLRRLLADELNVAPATATVSLYQEIVAALDEDPPPHLPVALPPPPILRDLPRLPLVGREQERNTLLDALQTATDGYPGLALIEGAAGIGKSRLVAELTADADWRGFRVGRGKAKQMTPAASYALLTQVLRDLLTPLRLTQLATLVTPRHLSAVAHLIPAIAEHIAGLPRLADPLDGRQSERLWEGVARCIAGLAQTVPVLILLEDLHWADEASLAALRNLFRWLDDSRLLIVTTYRPAAAWERGPVRDTLEALDRVAHITHIRLKALSADQTAALVQRALLRAGKQEATFAIRLWNESGGNPLLIIETLKMLLARGDMAFLPDGGWRLPDDDLPLPIAPPIRKLIRERLARLAPALRATLEWVAVLGESAAFDLLAHGSALPPSALIAHLAALVQQGFLVEQENVYHFEHNLIWESTYRGIPASQQQTLHRRAGDATEALHPEHIEALAFHFDRGHVAGKAYTYILQAGQQTARVGDYKSALAHYRRALYWANETSTARWDVLAHLENAHSVLGHRDAQREILNEMLHLAEALQDTVLQARTYYRQGWLEVLAGDPVQALELLDHATKLSRAVGDHDLLGECLMAVARAWWRIGDIASCQTAIETARPILQKVGDLQGETSMLNMLGNLHLGMTGNYALAKACFEENARIAQTTGDTYRAAAAQANTGIALTLMGDYRRSQTALAAAYPVMHRIGDRHWQGIIRHWQGVNYRHLGDLAQAQTAEEEALAICRQVGNRNFEIEALGALGTIALQRHDWTEAASYFQQAIEAARAGRQTMDQAVQQSYLALAHLRLGHGKQARALAEQAVTTLEGLGEEIGHLKEVYFVYYQVVAALEDTATAHPYLEQAYRALQTMAKNIDDPDMRHSFLNNVAENKAIVVAYNSGHVPTPLKQRSARLPHIDAPTGRPLRRDEFVEVTWTLAAPEDDEIPDGIARRRHRILRLLREAATQSAAPTVAALADALGVSARTIKRDLTALRTAGHNVQTRGSHTPSP